MKQVLIIPDRNRLEDCLKLAEEYVLGFEYNEFCMPVVLDDETQKQEIIKSYQKQELPIYTTVHGAFYDVIPFSMDPRIREVAELRVEQSIRSAKEIGAKAVVFHTNYNPFLHTVNYNKTWLDVNETYWSRVLEHHSDVNIYLENMFDATPDMMEELSRRLCRYTNYGVCLDYAHASLSKAEPEEWAKRLGKFVKHVHINDNDGISDLHLAWGDGVIDRQGFYECYERYLQGATVLIETSVHENKVRSLERLGNEGFLDC